MVLGAAGLEGLQGMSGDSVNETLVRLGKAQIDAMFCRQEDYPIDDSEFLPLVEAVLTGFEVVGIDEEVVEAAQDDLSPGSPAVAGIVATLAATWHQGRLGR